MSGKYSVTKCEQYGQRLAARLCDQHFGAAPGATLDGPAILAFTPIRQVNLLVVRQLFREWQAETSRLRSPYFNFEAPAVQAALIQFQNTLSRHIQLTRATFEPLLAQAVANTLLLAAEPAVAFERLLLNAEAAPTTASLREGLRYIELTKEFFNSFLDTLPATGSLVPGTVTTQLQAYQQANYQPSQSVQSLISSFHSLQPLAEADLLQSSPVSAAASAAASIPQSALAIDTAQPSAPAPVISSPPIAPAVPAPIAVSRTSAQEPTIEPARAQALTDLPLHEKLKATQPSVVPLAAALRAAQPQPAPLAERPAPKVETLREAISINQRFSFINELFNGENMEYHAAIQHLDSLGDYEQAQLYITQNLARRYDWSRKEEHLAKLLKLVERKYVPV